MFKNLKDKLALSGITVLLIGIALLIFTFISAYGFLMQNLSIFASQDLVRTFGEALAPLIVTCIRIMYLGVMGWVGSLVTIRGVTIITNAPKAATVEVSQKPTIPQTQPRPQPQPQPQKPKAEKPQQEKPPEPKHPEPEFVVIPPETMMQTTPPQDPQKQPEKTEAAPQSAASTS